MVEVDLFPIQHAPVECMPLYYYVSLNTQWIEASKRTVIHYSRDMSYYYCAGNCTVNNANSSISHLD